MSYQITFINNKKYYYIGNLDLLNNKTVSIVGTRRPLLYTKNIIYQIAKKLSSVGITIVSGGAMGVDMIAHEASGFDNTIMVAGTGLNKRYPSVNKNKIIKIEQNGLVLSEFEPNTSSLPRNFVIRNKTIVELSEILIVGEADINSGSFRSIEYALQLEKKIFVLPHRAGESEATNYLLKTNKAKAIYDIDKFVSQFGKIEQKDDKIIEFCLKNPTYDEAINRFGDIIFEYELLGKIEIKYGKVFVI